MAPTLLLHDLADGNAAADGILCSVCLFLFNVCARHYTDKRRIQLLEDVILEGGVDNNNCDFSRASSQDFESVFLI